MGDTLGRRGSKSQLLVSGCKGTMNFFEKQIFDHLFCDDFGLIL